LSYFLSSTLFWAWFSWGPAGFGTGFFFINRVQRGTSPFFILYTTLLRIFLSPFSHLAVFFVLDVGSMTFCPPTFFRYTFLRTKSPFYYGLHTFFLPHLFVSFGCFSLSWDFALSIFFSCPFPPQRVPPFARTDGFRGSDECAFSVWTSFVGTLSPPPTSWFRAGASDDFLVKLLLKSDPSRRTFKSLLSSLFRTLFFFWSTSIPRFTFFVWRFGYPHPESFPKKCNF